LSGGAGFALLNRMTLEEISARIKTTAQAMNARYGGIVFDEWAVVSLAENKARVLFYTGPRNDEFLQNFVKDLGPLRTELASANYGTGDFEFSRHGTGTRLEAFLVVGSGLFLVCNNTQNTMDAIAKNPRWLEAQVAFVELAEAVRAHPLVVSWDTKMFTKA
jgi:hypothetical protein